MLKLFEEPFKLQDNFFFLLEWVTSISYAWGEPNMGTPYSFFRHQLSCRIWGCLDQPYVEAEWTCMLMRKRLQECADRVAVGWISESERISALLTVNPLNIFSIQMLILLQPQEMLFSPVLELLSLRNVRDMWFLCETWMTCYRFYLSSLTQLLKIHCQDNIPFPQLQRLDVRHYHSLQYLFSLSLDGSSSKRR